MQIGKEIQLNQFLYAITQRMIFFFITICRFEKAKK